MLGLLAMPWMISVVSALAEEAARPAELEQRLPGIAHSVVIDRLHRLFACNLVAYERRPGTPPRASAPARSQQAVYTLTEAARMLLPVAAAARRWERAWRPPGYSTRRAELRAISLSADRRTREIVLGLAAGALSAAELAQRSPDLSRSALGRRLCELTRERLLARHQDGRVARYALTPAARQLALTAALAGQWEWRWARQSSSSPGPAITSLLSLIAPLARGPSEISGACRLRVDAPGMGSADVYIAARRGGVRLLEGIPAGRPDATGWAAPDGWCQALLDAKGSFTVSGDRALFEAVITALRVSLGP